MKSELHTIKPPKYPIIENIAQLWKYRDLMMTLVSKEIRIRYLNTSLGYLWAILQPIIMTGIMFLIFSRIGFKNESNIPYSAIALSGMILWIWFLNGMQQSNTILTQSQQMIQKIWFPRAVLPLSKLFSSIIDIVISFIIVLSLHLYYHLEFDVKMIFIPLFFVAFIALQTGWSLGISMISSKFKDIQLLVPFVLQMMFFISPIAFSQDFLAGYLSEEWKWLIGLNPMLFPIEFFRYLMGYSTNIGMIEWISLSIGIIMALWGWNYFSKNEYQLADKL